MFGIRRGISKNKQIRFLKNENKRLKGLCETKDRFFRELMSDALRHGSKLGGKHMIQWKQYKNGL